MARSLPTLTRRRHQKVRTTRQQRHHERAGWEKLHSPAWTGAITGAGLAGFIDGALTKAGGDHPNVNALYAGFLQTFVLPYAAVWSWAVTLGEFAVGIGLSVGCLRGIAAFFGGLMNVNYLFAGTVSTNPLLFAPPGSAVSVRQAYAEHHRQQQ